MLVLRKNQEKGWEEIEKLLKENGVNYVNIEKDSKELSNLYVETNIINEKMNDFSNQQFIESQLNILGQMARHYGYPNEMMDVIIAKDHPTEYASSHSLTQELGEGITEYLHQEGLAGVLEWMEDVLIENIYEYNTDHLEMREEENIQIKMPKQINKYSF